ncbi:MAG: lamin tail domain-containing protein [Gaiellaceae bacterium]
MTVLGGAGIARGTPTDVFFSEYIEGSSNNKALEIFNPTGTAVDLAAGGYNVQMYFNGAATAGLTINLTGTVTPGDVFVLAHSSADPVILAQADQTNGAGWFNGNDAVVLRRGTAFVDVIGQVGFNPGTEWGSGLVSTADNTLRRLGSIDAGDPDGSDAFDPLIQWNGFANNTFGGLGMHALGNEGVTATCGGPLTTPEGTPATRSVSATDPDGRVIDIQITSVTPDPAPGTIALSGLVPAGSTGGTATANIDVDAAVPAGNYAVLVAATNDDPTPQTGTCTLTVRVAGSVAIHDVQGASHISPYAGRAVITEGIVTARRLTSGLGFYIEDPTPDADDATSEGLFVFTSGTPAVSVGDEVRVLGLVTEFRAGGSASANLTTTELTSPSVTTLSTGNQLPGPQVVGSGGRTAPSTVIEDDATGDVETGGVFDPATDGIDFYESLEGMRVQVNDAVASGPSNDFGEISVLPDDGAGAAVRTTRGGIVVRPNDFNPERVILDDIIAATPAVNTGDHFATDIVGVLDYSFGNFKLLPTTGLTAVSSGLTREATELSADQEIAVATFNVENLDPNDPAAKFAALADIFVDNLRAPDIVSVEEVQDNNGEVNDAVTDASVTWAMLIAAIQAAGGPVYEYRQIDPVDDADGGVPGGNIRVGFLFRTDRGVEFIDRPGGGPTTSTTVIDHPSGPQLSSSPGRIAPGNPAWSSPEGVRKPLVGEFIAKGKKLFVIANHWKSKGGDDPLFGRFQPPTLVTEPQRTAEAVVVNDFVDDILAADPFANVVVLGDLNDFEFSPPLTSLEGGGALHTLIESLPPGERYSYVFDGNSQTLDQIVVSENLFSHFPFEYDSVHVNAEFAVQASDHDPQVARFRLTGRPRP